MTAALDGLGLAGVETFLASGNVLFEPDASVGDSAIEEAMRATLGFSVEVTSRSAAELAALAETRPFSEEATEASTGSPQVMLLFEPVTPAMRAAVEAADTADAFEFGQRELHWLPRAGVSDSDLRPIHRAVGPNTIRSARTIARLVGRL
jgi:uncharacterized protein (DUF1697 family)